MSANTPRGPATPLRLLLTVQEAAAALGLSRSKMYELIACGTVPALKIGRSTRVPVRELEALVTHWTTERNAAEVGSAARREGGLHDAPHPTV